MDDKPISELTVDSEGVKEDASGVPEWNKRVSLRKRRPNSKYNEDNVVGNDASKAVKDFNGSVGESCNVLEGIKRISSRQRKPNTKYIEDEGATQSGAMEEDVVTARVLEVKKSEEATKNVSQYSKQNTQASLRKRKAKFKGSEDGAHIEEEHVGTRVPKEVKGSEGATEDTSQVPEGNKHVSSRKRKPNTKHIEDEGATQSGVVEECVVYASSRKRKAKFKGSENEGKALLEEEDVSARVWKEEKVSEGTTQDTSQVSEGNKRVSSRKRKPSTKYGEDEGKARIDFLMEDIVDTRTLKDSEGVAHVSQIPKVTKQVSSPKGKQTNKYLEGESKSHIGINEGINDFEGPSEDAGNVPEGNKGISLRKRNPNTKYNENVDEEDIEVHVSEETDDCEAVAEDAIWVPEENKRVSLRKRKPNTKYSEDDDYSFDATGEQPVFMESLRKMWENEISKGSSKRNDEKFQRRKLTPAEHPSPDSILLHLHIAAIDPMKGHSHLASLIGFFADYRNSISQGPKRAISRGISKVEGEKNSYLTDWILESNLEPETIERETDGAGYRDEKSEEDYTPTAVILFFADIDSVPSKSDLHHIFGCYGPMNKANTEVVKRLKRARVVFKRRSDADNAFKSTGRFSIFGPSLVSYRLSYFYPD